VWLSDAGRPDDVPTGAAAAEVALGIEIGLEPQARFADDGASGVVITRSSSWWNYRRCTTCGQTFRRGDRVLVDSVRRTVQHLVPGLACGSDPGLVCGSDPGLVAMAGADRNAFTVGLLRTWPPAVPVTRIKAGDWRIPRPGSTRPAPKCLYCGHTFRDGEYVVVCPCQSDQGRPPACGAAVHRDPAAGLPCWDNWQPGGRLVICPTTTAKL
jgi:hypothetical protein